MVTFASACRTMRSGVSNEHYRTYAAAHVYEQLFWPLVEQNIYIAIRGAIRHEAHREVVASMVARPGIVVAIRQTAVGREEAS